MISDGVTRGICTLAKASTGLCANYYTIVTMIALFVRLMLVFHLTDFIKNLARQFAV